MAQRKELTTTTVYQLLVQNDPQKNEPKSPRAEDLENDAFLYQGLQENAIDLDELETTGNQGLQEDEIDLNELETAENWEEIDLTEAVEVKLEDSSDEEDESPDSNPDALLEGYESDSEWEEVEDYPVEVHPEPHTVNLKNYVDLKPFFAADDPLDSLDQFARIKENIATFKNRQSS